MTTRVVWWLLAVALAAACGEEDDGTKAHVIKVVPEAATLDARDLEDGLKLTFDRAVARPGDVGRALPASPVHLVPAVEGTARWADAQTLVFTWKGPLQPATRYAVSIDRLLRGRAEVAIAAWKGSTFVYQPLEIESVAFPGGPELQPGRPVVTVHFTLPVRPQEAAAACRFEPKGGGAIEAVRPAFSLEPGAAEEAPAAGADGGAGPSGDPDGPVRAVRLTPATPLPAGTDHVLRCRAGLRPAAGGEALGKDDAQPFHTYGPLVVVRFGPAGNDVAADDVRVELETSTPVDPAELRKHFRATVENGARTARIVLSGDADRRHFAWKGNLDPGVGYTLTVGKGLRDAFGQELAGEARHEFHVGDASPRLKVERGIWAVERSSGRAAVWTRNLSSFTVNCARVPDAKIASITTGVMNYDAWWSSEDRKPIDFGKIGLRARQKKITVRHPKNKWHDDALDLAAQCGGGPGEHPSGVYLVELDAEEAPLAEYQPPRRLLANVTDLGLLAKVGNASSLVWAVHLSTGKPAVGARITLRDLKGKVRWSGATGGDGVALAPGASKLMGVKPRGESRSGGDAQGDGEGDGEDEGAWEELRARRLLVTAQEGADLAVLDTNWNNGIQIWNFGVPDDRRGGDVRVRGFLQSDRGLYRPGDTVHLRGLVRSVDATGRMTVPGGKGGRVHVTVSDPKGATVLEEDLTPSRFGGFARDVVIGEDARLGDWSVRGTVAGQTFTERFAVEEYRPRTFEVKLDTPRKHTFLGQRLRFSLRASYLYGAPLRAGTVKWAVRRRPLTPRFPGFPEYVFQDMAALWDEGRFWARDEDRSFSDLVGDGEIALDAKGRAQVVAQDDTRKLETPQEYVLEATVTDASGQGVTASELVAAHRSALYLGLHPAEFVQAVNMPFAVQAVAMTPDGKRRAATAKLSLARRSTDCGAHTGAWGCERKQDKAAIVRSLEIPETGNAVERVVLAEPGEYLVSIEAPDGRGGTAVASELIYVVGPGEAFWSGEEGDRMAVVASKSEYAPGETARLVPQANLPGALALVTLERDGIVSHFTRILGGTGEAIEIPVDGKLAPNVFASVALVRGRTGDEDKGRPRFKMGMVDLKVSSADKRLHVAVETDRPSYQPGDEVGVTLRLSDAHGAPVVGEIALAAADEGVLQIAGYRTPDPMAAFYAAWGLGVESSTTWNRVARRTDPNLSDDDGEGGDGGDDAEGGRVRSRFVATAFWAPALITDAAGTAHVHFAAPDNLTAFRLMAVAADAGDRFGSSDRRFSVVKPLLAMPALPRFLQVGDEAQAAVVVHNNTAARLVVDVAANVEGATLTGAATAKVEVAPGGVKPVAFGVRATTAGEATFRFTLRGGEDRDAVEIKLPVTRPLVQELAVVGEGAAAGQVEHALVVPAGVVPDQGGLDVVLDGSGLAGLDEGLKYLIGYPYGCLEQTTSKVVPMVALQDLAGSLDLPDLDTHKLRGFVEAGIAKLGRHQHDDGGFGLWIGSQAEAHYTAFALWGLGVARAAGYKVDPAVLAGGVRYLRANIDHAPEGYSHELAGWGSARAFGLWVLAELGQADAGAAAKLFGERALLPRFGRAFLARALKKGGDEASARTLIDELGASIAAGTGPVIVAEDKEHDLAWYWSSDVRTTAIVLSALLDVAPGHPLTERLAQGLLGAREQGRWSNTQENLWAMVALADVARARRAGAPGQVTVSLGGKVLATAKIGGGDVRRVSVPLDRMAGGGTLAIDARGRTIYYAARLRTFRNAAADAAANGLTVTRQYLDPETDAPVDRITLGQVVKVRLSLEARARHTHVALVDHLPAAFEPVLDRFQRTGTGDDDQRRWSWWRAPETRWDFRQLRDDRAEHFAEVVLPGASQREYLVRATTAGTFLAPPATAEAMYQPRIGGHSAATTLTVVR